MKRTLGLGVAALMSATALAGCGGGSDSSSGGYCDDIKAAQTQFKGLETTNFTGDQFSQMNDTIHKLADEAPDEIKSSWEVLSTQFDALKSAMSDAGLTMDDFGKLSQGDTSGIDPSKLTQLMGALKNFDTQGITAATTKITNQVKSDCDVDLNTGP